VLLDRTNLPRHGGWLAVVLVATAAAGWWYFGHGRGASVRPGGGSLPGFTFGVAGGAIILFEMLLWPRKKLRAWRIGRAETWMKAHIWLGLLSVPLLVLHSGFRLGGTLSTLLMVLFLAVIGSGVFGLVLQQFLPRMMLDRLPAETIYSQIDRLSDQLREEAERLVLATCGPEGGAAAAPSESGEGPAGRAAEHVAVAVVRSAGRVHGKAVQTVVPTAPVPGAEALRDFHRRAIEPFLRSGGRAGSPLRYVGRAAELFGDLRMKLDASAHPAVASLEGLCNQRRQFDEQLRLHVWLHAWLWLHFPLSVALVVLMFIHAWEALKYW
jgi:hypothetical protein